MTEQDRLLTDEIAGLFMVNCEDCLHNEYLANDCPHLDEEICMWQRELANEALAKTASRKDTEWQERTEQIFNDIIDALEKKWAYAEFAELACRDKNAGFIKKAIAKMIDDIKSIKSRYLER